MNAYAVGYATSAKHVPLLNLQRVGCQQLCIRDMSAQKGIAQDTVLGNDKMAAEFGLMLNLDLFIPLVKIVKLVSWELSYTITHQEGFYNDEPRSSLSSQDLTIFAPSQEREVYFVVVLFVLQMLHFAVGVIDERALFGQTLYMLQYQSHWSNGTRMVRDIGFGFSQAKSTVNNADQLSGNCAAFISIKTGLRLGCFLNMI